MNEFTTTRHNPLIDPTMHVWHGEVAGYLFLGGVVAGIMVLMGAWLLMRSDEDRSEHLSLVPWTAPILLSIGMLLLWLDLENRFNAFRFYFVFRPLSPMSWGSWILLAIYPASLMLAWYTTPDVLRRKALDWIGGRIPTAVGRLQRVDAWILGHRTSIAWVNVLAGAALGVYTGLLLGTMASRPLWNSAVLGPLFLTSGLSTGAAYMLLYRLEDVERVLLTRVDMGLIVVELALVAIWLIGMATGGELTHEAMTLLVSGPYSPAFWSLVVGFGLVVPLLGDWIEQAQGHVPGRLAAFMVLVGGFALRWIIVYAGQHTGFSEGMAALF